MLGLPKATELNKKLPKTAVYAKFQMDTAEKAKIDADISRITIVNEVSATKVNIAPGEKVQAFFVLQVMLKRREFNERTLIVLSKLIPQNMVLLLEYDGCCVYVAFVRSGDGVITAAALPVAAATIDEAEQLLLELQPVITYLD